jgi:hypothetical protein
MSKAPGPDPYRDPASGVLHNLLASTNPDELAEAEAALSASRLIDLELRVGRRAADRVHLRLQDSATHRARAGSGRPSELQSCGAADHHPQVPQGEHGREAVPAERSTGGLVIRGSALPAPRVRS